jgi:glycosyltransferase involved in cell wall biosynthesis
MSPGNSLNESIKISIIIPTVNRAKYLEKTLNSLIHQNFSSDQFEIIIVDGGSTDTTKDICTTLIRTKPNYSIRYIYEPEPGLLAGRHRGALEAKGEILTFIDDDIEASQNWLYSIYEAFGAPIIHLVGGKNLPEYEVEPPSWLTYLWNTTIYGGNECGDLSLLDLGNKTLKIHPNYIWGLNFSIRKKTLFEVGGFHPDSYPKTLQRFQGDGESGLTTKLFERGYGALYHPDVKIFHIIPPHRMTTEYFEKRWYFQGVANSYSGIRKINNPISEDPKISQDPKFSTIFIPDLRRKISAKIINKLLSKICFYLKTPKEVRELKKKMQKSYNEGYKFHQNQVKNDPELLKWVLKENYWDYHLPIDKKEFESTTKFEKSY